MTADVQKKIEADTKRFRDNLRKWAIKYAIPVIIDTNN